ncbi:MAG: hypothetical protein QM831_03110 [Kofleriaceae bacterium]
MALKGVHVFPELAFGELDNCMLVVWREPPTIRTTTLLIEALAALCERCPEGAAIVQIVEPGSKAPDEATRKATADGLREIGPNLKAVGFVFEGDQFRIALNRAVITTLMFFQKHPHPTKVFRTPHDALAFVAARVDVTEDLVENAELALEHLRRRIDHRAHVVAAFS